MTDAAVDIRLVNKMSQLKEGAQGQGKTFFLFFFNALHHMQSSVQLLYHKITVLRSSSETLSSLLACHGEKFQQCFMFFVFFSSAIGSSSLCRARPTGFDMSDVFVSVCLISPCEPSRGTTKMSIMSSYELQRMERPQSDCKCIITAQSD